MPDDRLSVRFLSEFDIEADKHPASLDTVTVACWEAYQAAKAADAGLTWTQHLKTWREPNAR